MKLEEIKNKIKNSKVKPEESGVKFAVLLPLIEIENELNILFEVRSHNIRQPGEVSFPGGQIEFNETPAEAAVRETFEEIGIFEEKIELISELDYTTTRQGNFIHSFAGIIKDIDFNNLAINEDEVSEVFLVPLSFFLNNEPEKYNVNYYPQPEKNFPHHMVNNGEKYNWSSMKHPVYFYKYNDYVIWGLTAKITYNFIKKIKYSQE